MNARRRKELQKAMELIEQAWAIVEAVKEEEIEAFENLPEGLQRSAQGEAMEEIAYGLEDVVGTLEEQAEYLNEIIEGRL